MEKLSLLKNRNILGTALRDCCHNPKTGYYRDGFCRAQADDIGNHSVCAVMTEEFLEFSASSGNDLTTPRPEFGFPGLKPGDQWCLCASRWTDALEAGVAPPVILESCSQAALEEVKLKDLEAHAYTN
jgi:uncharacterized protein (DUF2237 family)